MELSKAYIIVSAARRDEVPATDAYLSQFRRALADHGGRVIIGTEQIEHPKGSTKIGRLVVVEFDNKAAAQAAFEQYQQEAMPLHPGGTRDLYIAEGLPDA